MSPLQPRPLNRPNGTSRDGHDRDRGSSRTPSRQIAGTFEHRDTPSRTAISSRQRLTAISDDPYHGDSDLDHGFHDSRHENGSYQPYQQYTAVPRSQRSHSSALDRVVNSRALNDAPPPSRRPTHDQRPRSTQSRSSAAHSSTTAPPALTPGRYMPSQNFNSGHGNPGQLTLENLQAHNQRQPQRNNMRRLMRQDQRAGPYDAIGYIRQDGQVFDEYEVYDQYEDYYDARSDN